MVCFLSRCRLSLSRTTVVRTYDMIKHDNWYLYDMLLVNITKTLYLEARPIWTTAVLYVYRIFGQDTLGAGSLYHSRRMLSFWRSTAAVPMGLHGIPRLFPRHSTGNRGNCTGYRGHYTGYRGNSSGFHGHSMSFHKMPRQVAEHRGGPWH